VCFGGLIYVIFFFTHFVCQIPFIGEGYRGRAALRPVSPVLHHAVAGYSNPSAGFFFQFDSFFFGVEKQTLGIDIPSHLGEA